MIDGGGIDQNAGGGGDEGSLLSIRTRIALGEVERGVEGANDDVIGTPFSDVIGSGLGQKLMVGLEGRDGFLYDVVSFKPNDIDAIADFEGGEDSIWLDPGAFPKVGKNGVKFKSVNSQKKLNKLAGKGKFNIYYNTINGEMIYDDNGKKKGFGGGGVFGLIDNERSMFKTDFQVAPQGPFSDSF